MHSRNMLISLCFFIVWELFSFLSPFASNFTKVNDNVLLFEEDPFSSAKWGDKVISYIDSLLLFSIKTSTAWGNTLFSIISFNLFRTDSFPVLFSVSNLNLHSDVLAFIFIVHIALFASFSLILLILTLFSYDIAVQLCFSILSSKSLAHLLLTSNYRSKLLVTTFSHDYYLLFLLCIEIGLNCLKLE